MDRGQWMDGGQRENTRMVLAIVGTIAVLLAFLAAAGMYSLRKRRASARLLDAPTPPEPLPGSEPAEA